MDGTPAPLTAAMTTSGNRPLKSRTGYVDATS